MPGLNTGDAAGDTYAGIENLAGSGLGDTLFGNAATNDLAGAGGDDSLNGGGGNDRLDGGAGGDAMNGGVGLDSASYASSGGGLTARLDTPGLNSGDAAGDSYVSIENLTGSSFNDTLVGNAANNTLDGAAGNDNLAGGDGNDRLNGAGGTDSISGGAGADTMDGGAGGDAMTGGIGDDTYVVDNVSESVTELAGEGFDTAMSSISYTLGANVERLVLTGNAISGTGNALANTLVGTGAANTIDGGVGGDQMRGLAGNDTYIVDNVGDAVFEINPAHGTDTVRSSVTFSLGSYTENLVLTGGAAIDGNGNTLVNVLQGNGAANQLNGGQGADEMRGDAGNDTYIVDNVADVVSETAGNGTDTVRSGISHTLTANVENLVLTGALAVDGTGNTLANALTGNNGINTLAGGSGNDALDGGGGGDRLHGGAGNDALTGGASLDGFFFDAPLNAATNVDQILDFSTAQDSIYLDRDIFTGIAASGTLAAGAFRAGTTALDADDRILYQAATGQIRYDADGAGGAAAILFATVTPGLALTNADFVGYV